MAKLTQRELFNRIQAKEIQKAKIRTRIALCAKYNDDDAIELVTKLKKEEQEIEKEIRDLYATVKCHFKNTRGIPRKNILGFF